MIVPLQCILNDVSELNPFSNRLVYMSGGAGGL